MLQDRLALSERRACRVTGQHRSTQRRLPARGRGDDALRTELHAFSRGSVHIREPPFGPLIDGPGSAASVILRNHVVPLSVVHIREQRYIEPRSRRRSRPRKRRLRHPPEPRRRAGLCPRLAAACLPEL